MYLTFILLCIFIYVFSLYLFLVLDAVWLQRVSDSFTCMEIFRNLRFAMVSFVGSCASHPTFAGLELRMSSDGV